MLTLHEVHVVLHVAFSVPPLRDVSNLLMTTKTGVELDSGVDSFLIHLNSFVEFPFHPFGLVSQDAHPDTGKVCP